MVTKLMSKPAKTQTWFVAILVAVSVQHSARDLHGLSAGRPRAGAPKPAEVQVAGGARQTSQHSHRTTKWSECR